MAGSFGPPFVLPHGIPSHPFRSAAAAVIANSHNMNASGCRGYHPPLVGALMNIVRTLAVLVLSALGLGFAPDALAASTCTVTASQVDGRKHVKAVIVETGARDTTEVACSGVPAFGTIVSIEATLTAGTGTTINPILGRAAAFAASTQDHIATATTTAAHLHEQGSTAYYSSTGVLYVRSRPNNTTTDHAISTEILIVEGAL